MIQKQNSYIYVASMGGGPLKIGFTKNMSVRLYHLRRKFGKSMEFVNAWAFERGVADKIERHAHWLLKEKLITLEWFDITEREATQAIQDAYDYVQSDGPMMPRIERRIRSGKPRVRPPHLSASGRKLMWHEIMQARFADGTFARIAAVLSEDEDRTEFLREAVEREIQRRVAQPKSG